MWSKRFGLVGIAAAGLLAASLWAGSGPASSTSARTSESSASVAWTTFSCGGGLGGQIPPTPPAGFDPLTATDAQLDTYGYAPRPAATSAYFATWQHYVTHPITWGGPETCSSAGATTNGVANHGLAPRSLAGASVNGYSNTHWAGNVTNGGYPYSDAESYVQLPSTVTGGTGQIASFWVGINVAGTATYPLWQTGVDVRVGAGPALWYESFPGTTTPAPYPTAAYGDMMYFHASVTPGTGAAYTIVDVSNNQSRRYVDTTQPGQLDGHAEVIVERPAYVAGLHACYFNPLANYSNGGGTFSIAQIAAQGPWHHVDYWPHWYYWMEDGAGQLAFPGSINSAGDFTVSFIQAGNKDNFAC